jgi:hypothetical protein
MSSETERITNEVLNRHDLGWAIMGPARANLEQVEGGPLTPSDSRSAGQRYVEADAPTNDGRPDFLSRILGWMLTRPSRISDPD